MRKTYSGVALAGAIFILVGCDGSDRPVDNGVTTDIAPAESSAAASTGTEGALATSDADNAPSNVTISEGGATVNTADTNASIDTENEASAPVNTN